MQNDPMIEKGRCFVCGSFVDVKPADPNEVRPPWFMSSLTCWHCRKAYPPSLIKACRDSFHYTLRVRGIRDMIEFTRARINGDWVTIFNEYYEGGVNVDGVDYIRGYEIALHEITGCSDAPDIPFPVARSRYGTSTGSQLSEEPS